MRMSSSTTSGLCLTASLTASAPLRRFGDDLDVRAGQQAHQPGADDFVIVGH